jgi:hypothetical protein
MVGVLMSVGVMTVGVMNVGVMSVGLTTTNNDLTPAKLQNMLTDLLNVFLNPISVNSAILS